MARILVIDDDFAFRTSLKSFLERENHNVSESKNGFDGLTRIQNEFYDIIITDIIMPKKDGIELINDLRRMKSTTKVIAISGGGQIRAEDHLLNAKILGADRVIKKPFSGHEMLQAVNSLLHN